MSQVEDAIAGHYSKGGLLPRILDGLRQAGLDIDDLAPEDLIPVEHYHTGGAPATARLIAQMDLGPARHVLDIGSGIGGVARAIAHATGARVTGFDLTPDFVATADALSKLVGLDARTHFHVASGLDMPVNDRFFDAAVLVHVGMNIGDKERLFAEAFRTLHPGGMFAVYEVMEGPDPGPLEFPVPWAAAAEMSFVAAPATYRDAAARAGFHLVRETDYRKAVLEKHAAHPPKADMGPLGQHLMMGDTAPQKVANYGRMMKLGRVTPVEMLFLRPLYDDDPDTGRITG